MTDNIAKDVVDLVGEAAELALHALELARIQSVPPGRHGRGLVLPLTRLQRMQRALYLAQLADITTLDPWVPREGNPKQCITGFYRRKDHNGGKDPTKPDPFDRWFEIDERGVRHERLTADCVAAAAWIGGWDRYQPNRFAHIYKGWINTDSMRMDAGGKAKCFQKLDAPEPGCYVVCATGSPGHENCGHIGTIVGGCDGFVRADRDAWQRLEVVDIASRGARRANQLTTARGWFGTDAWFVVPTMKP